MLLDENVPHDLRACLRHHNAFTVSYLGWAGLKNGQLLDAADRAGFDVLVTGDKTLQYEQSLSGRNIALVFLSALGWPIIEPYVDRIAAAIDNATAGSFTYVDCGVFRRGKKPKRPFADR